MLLNIHEGRPRVPVRTPDELDSALKAAADEAQSCSRLAIVLLEADNGDAVIIVVGGEETVLGFYYAHGNPPYYASHGSGSDIDPVLTCYHLFEHHTELPRSYVIPMAQGLRAAHEFLRTAALPQCVAWDEV